MSNTTTHLTMLTSTPPPTITPGTGKADFPLVVAALSTASLSLFSCLLVLAIFLIHIQRPATVIRNSLNYMWGFVVFVAMLGAIQTITGRALWYDEGDGYAGSKTFCSFGAAVSAGERVLLALSLLAFYVNMYVVRKYDEPFAMRCVKWYFLVIVLGTAGIVTFAAITAPDSFEKHDDRCVLIVDSVQGNVPLALPLVAELAIVVIGLVSAFGLLCSRSRINNTSSRRRVWIHVFFMTFLFFARLAMTVSTIVYGVREEEGYYKKDGNGSQVTQLDEAPMAIRVMLFINMAFTWAMGFIVSAIFGYTECLYLVLRMWCANNCGGGELGEEYEPFMYGNNQSSPSFTTSDNQSSANPHKRNGTDADETNSQSSSRYGGGGRHDEDDLNVGAGAGLGMGRPPGSHLSARVMQSAVSLEEHLQGYTLSYTIRSSSNFADGEIPSGV